MGFTVGEIHYKGRFYDDCNGGLNLENLEKTARVLTFSVKF